MRILICEDDRSILKVLTLTLQVRGHEVDATDSAQEAIETFDRRQAEGKSYDMVLLDIMMPGQSGFAVGGHVRGCGYTGRLAFLTAGRAEYANLSHLEAEYWHKPEALDNLIERVEGLPFK